MINVRCRPFTAKTGVRFPLGAPMISSNYGQPSRLIARGAQHLPDKRSRTSTAHAAHDDEAANQLSAAESDAIEILAETPCASDAEFLEKLHEIRMRAARKVGKVRDEPDEEGAARHDAA